MSDISTLLKSFPDLVSLKPVEENEITIAEKQLKLSFAPEYKEYTSEYGAVCANGHEITGVVASKRLDVVSVTNNEWQRNPQVPHSMYVIENAGIDGIIIWQDASGKIYQSSPNSMPMEVAGSLADYISS